MNTIDLIVSKYKEMSRKGGEIELEARIQGYIQMHQYNRLRKELEKEKRGKEEEEIETTQYKGGIRKNERGGEVEWERKTKENVDIREIGVRIGISREEKIGREERKEAREIVVIRKKKRESYYVIENWRIDMTEVREIPYNDKGEKERERKIYEVEIEWIGKREIRNKDIEQLIGEIIRIKMIIDGTEIFMSLNEKNDIIREYNNSLQLGGNFIKFPPTKPIDLHYKDLTYENMIVNKYSITAKADGYRKILMINKHGCYFITNDINKISNPNPKWKNLNIIIDTELVDDTLYIFDVLLYQNKIVADIADLQQRLGYAEIIVKTLNTIQTSKTKLNIKIKKFVYFSNFEEFSKGILRIIDNAEFPTDGLIFTPINVPYFASNNQPSIKKWKPIDDLTIDFEIIDTPPFIGVKDNQNKIVPFDGTKDNKITSENVDIDYKNYHIGQIVEFKWNPDNKLFYTYRLRSDKIEPNFINIAFDTFSLIINPISLDTLLGNDLVLMRKYHNREKEKIYKLLTDFGVINITDFGSGFGGDILKWRKNYLDVIAVEPNRTNILELYNRLLTYGYTTDPTSLSLSRTSFNPITFQYFVPQVQDNYVIVINSSAESYLPSPIEKTNAVTMFNSLTFFYDTPDHVDHLLSVVKSSILPSGYFVVVALDGHKLRLFFPEDFSGNSISINYTSSGLNISMKASGIVDRQDEFLTDFDDFKQRLSSSGFSIISDFFLDSEPFMSLEQFDYSSSTRVLISQFLPSITSSSPLKSSTSNPSITSSTKSSTSKSSTSNANNKIAILPTIKSPIKSNKTSNVSEDKTSDTRIYRHKMETLNMDETKFLPANPFGDNLIRIGTLLESSCFLHSVVGSFSQNYQQMSKDDRKKYIVNLRKNLSDSLSKNLYLSLVNNLSQSSYERSKHNLCNPSSHIGHEYLQYISNLLDLNIYITDRRGWRLLNFPDSNTLYDPNRDSIFLLWNGDTHYEIIGLYLGNNNVQTLFHPNDPLSKLLYSLS